MMDATLSFNALFTDFRSKNIKGGPDIINKIKPPFNTTTISQSLAIKALEDKEHIENSVKLNSEIKDWFEKELKLLNIKTRQTEGNFTLIETSEEEAEVQLHGSRCT